MNAAPEDEAPEVERRDDEREPPTEEGERKQIYLRTVYPLNPGIPHFVDFPGGW
jgi:hypothetical protein